MIDGPHVPLPTPDTFGLGLALEFLRNGRFVSRRGWNGPNQYLGLQVPDGSSANTLPYVWIYTTPRERVPWVCSQSDLLAQDWYIVEP